jgi:hypothetical protein
VVQLVPSAFYGVLLQQIGQNPPTNESLLGEVRRLPYAFGLQQMAALVLRDDF